MFMAKYIEKNEHPIPEKACLALPDAARQEGSPLTAEFWQGKIDFYPLQWPIDPALVFWDRCLWLY